TELKYTISIIDISLIFLLILQFRLNQTTRRDFSIGGLSGTFTTRIGMPGPPLLLYFSNTNTPKEKLRGTTLAFYLFIYSISLVIQVIFEGTSKVIWLSSLQALPVVII